MSIGRRILRDLLGFIAAAFAASLMFHLMIGVASWTESGDALIFSPDVIVTLLFGTFVICVNAFLPAVLIILATEYFRVRHLAVYVLGGAAASLSSSLGVYLIGLTGSGGINPTLMCWIVAAGAGAGLVYWAIAGRFAGSSPEKAVRA